MNRTLYFIPLIEKALAQSNPRKALVESFREIQSLGRDPAYSDGFAMFLSFMEEVAENWKLQDLLSSDAGAAILEDFSLQLAADTASNAPFSEKDQSGLPPALLEQIIQRLNTLSLMDTEPIRMEVDVIRDTEIHATIQLDPTKPVQRIAGILPGKYTFRLGSGRVLWEVELEEKDLILKLADPGQNLKLAADTGEERRLSPTRKMAALSGELVFRVFPGIESGWIEIETRIPQWALPGKRA
jgi:hypothetical protein